MNEFAIEPTSSETLLREGQTCWKNTIAERATLLVDGEEYYRALRDALLKAQRQILIAGWDFDTRAQLPRDPTSRDRTDAEAPTELGELLGFLLRRRPELEIHVLRWDYHWFYGDDREWNTRERLQKHGVYFHEHPARLITGCVHHKIVVIDDVLGFCGGIDLTHKRWDTCLHEPDEARRHDHCSKSYKPVHDTQLCVSGAAAAWLGEYVRRHWPETASVPAPAPISDAAPIWPAGLHVDFVNICTGIARTLPDISEAASSREIEVFYLAAIAATKHTLYIENQYFTSERIAEAIATQFRREPKLEGLLVGLDQAETPAEYHTMGYGRARFCNILAARGVTARIPLVAALCRNGRAINVHSKIAVFDDRWLMVGSANLNRRSMGFDLECNLVLEASTSAHRARIVQLRNRLLGEHLGLELDEVAAVLKMHGLARLPEAVRGSRRLARVDPQQSEPNLGPILAPVFDREENWPAVTPPTVRIEQLQGVLLLAVAVTAAAFTSRVVAEDLPTLHSLQRLVTQLLNG